MKNECVVRTLTSPVPLLLKLRVPGGEGSLSQGVEVDTGTLDAGSKDAWGARSHQGKQGVTQVRGQINPLQNEGDEVRDERRAVAYR